MMRDLRVDLSTHCPWAETLVALGQPDYGKLGLPARVQCPVCDGPRMSIYENTISGGTWHYCFDCHQAGDAAELAAAVWRVGPGAAASRLADLGVIPYPVDPAAAVRYEKEFPGDRARMSELATKAFQYYPKCEDTDVCRLRGKFRLRNRIPAERWARGPGRLIGAYPRTEVDRVLAPHLNKDVVRRGSKFFRCRGWRDVLVVPYYDLPGRVCGFLFVGRQADQEHDFVHVNVAPHIVKGFIVKKGTPSKATRNRSNIIREGGLSGLWTADENLESFGGHVFACGDAFVALRLQIRHYGSADAPLPLVAYRDAGKFRTETAWQAIHPRKPVIWGWGKLTASMLHQAIVSDGKLSVVPMADTSPHVVDHYIRNNDPRQILRKLLYRAKPWREYLTHWVKTASPREIEDLVLSARTYGDDIRDVLLPKCQSRELDHLLEDRRPAVTVIGHYTYREIGDRWEVRRDGSAWETWLDGILRVDGTAMEPTFDSDDNAEVAMYRCRLIFRGEEIPFRASVESMTSHSAGRLLQTVLAKHRPGAVLEFPTVGHGLLLRVAQRFQPFAEAAV